MTERKGEGLGVGRRIGGKKKPLENSRGEGKGTHGCVRARVSRVFRDDGGE